MNDYYSDLHIHIGRTNKGRAVKITGSRTLTLSNILHTASANKGLDLIGIIDSHSPEVLAELEEYVRTGKMTELAQGGLLYEKTTLIMGSELEIYDANCQGPIHVLAYLPTLQAMQAFSAWLSEHMKNIHLSSQRIYCDARSLQQKVAELNGLFIPAHVFTPFKSLYGKGVMRSLTEVFDPTIIDAIELGLSADTDMVRGIEELAAYTFVTNSDAHSLGKIAREYQKIQMEAANFEELRQALHRKNGRAIVTNYGLHPLLGKYHETVCAACGKAVKDEAGICPFCHSKHIVRGVATRIQQLSSTTFTTVERPPYIHQVPLEFIPGLGKKTLDKLLAAFDTEMNILHRTTMEQLLDIVPQQLAEKIILARTGQLAFEAGGGGVYGKIKL
ncbi:endonuclease Q family protein [Metasolibacillus meyeri]|uniref:endonuclease Q family protein n=1 Tax=Metasolibacillus meyeri TaxID=1071052 RepID=UPI000D32233B|nr:endonuclease Q family protein [Metasolibacillus meyeri]